MALSVAVRGEAWLPQMKVFMKRCCWRMQMLGGEPQGVR